MALSLTPSTFVAVFSTQSFWYYSHEACMPWGLTSLIRNGPGILMLFLRGKFTCKMFAVPVLFTTCVKSMVISPEYLLVELSTCTSIASSDTALSFQFKHGYDFLGYCPISVMHGVSKMQKYVFIATVWAGIPQKFKFGVKNAIYRRVAPKQHWNVKIACGQINTYTYKNLYLIFFYTMGISCAEGTMRLWGEPNWRPAD